MVKRLTTRTVGAMAAAVLLTGLAGCGSDDGPETSGEPSSEAPEVECTYEPDGAEPARPVEPPPSTPAYTDKVTVTIETTAGPLSATLNGDTTPCTVNSFLSLAEQSFFDDSPCPRITTEPGFQLLQCGDPSGTGSAGPGYYVQDELTGKETYTAGTLAMANIGQPDTGGSQFFIVYGDAGLAPDYTVFGTVDAADLPVIEGIAADGDDGSHPAGGGVPNTPIDITSVAVAE